MNKLLLLFFFQIIAYSVVSQYDKDVANVEDSISHYFNKLLNYQADYCENKYGSQTVKVVNRSFVTEDSAKLIYCEKISDFFNEILKKKSSFNYPFFKLKHISSLKSSDSLVRIIGWNIPLSNGSHKYYAFIQKYDKHADKITLYNLTDASERIKKPQYTKLKPNKWYGAIYYKIITNYFKDKTYYTLLGWDGNNRFSNKRIIECFSFNKERLSLGEPIFKMGDNIQNRVIFEYAKQVRMMLRYDEKINMIVYDHLSPESRKFEGQYMYYGPDMSHDGLKFNKGIWVLQENLNLKNKMKVKVKELPKSF